MVVILATCPAVTGPYELFAISGNTAALPPEETVIGTFANMGALLAAYPPVYVGQRIQVAIGDQVELYEANYIDNAWSWVLVPAGDPVTGPLVLSNDTIAGGAAFGPGSSMGSTQSLSNDNIAGGSTFGF